jgi:hypothetical protein
LFVATVRSKPTPPLASTAYASSEHQPPTQADDEAVVQTAGDQADPGQPSRATTCRHRRAPPHFGRPQRTRTRTPDVGHRTSDTGHLDARTPAPDTGHGGVDRHVSTLGARTEDWTPNAGRGRGQDDGMAGIRAVSSHHAERSRTGDAYQISTVFLWKAPLALGSHAGSDLRPPAGARLALALPAALGRSAGQGAPRRTALLLENGSVLSVARWENSGRGIGRFGGAVFGELGEVQRVVFVLLRGCARATSRCCG